MAAPRETRLPSDTEAQLTMPPINGDHMLDASLHRPELFLFRESVRTHLLRIGTHP